MTIYPCSISAHDWNLTLVSICVIFSCLIVLFAVYSIMGMVNAGKKPADNEASGEKTRAEKEDGIHDVESGVITIRSSTGASSALTTSRAAGTSGGGSVRSSSGLIKSPLPGVVLKVFVKEGQDIRKGEKVAVLEAMKMENDILCEKDGKVLELNVAPGDSVLEGALIARIG